MIFIINNLKYDTSVMELVSERGSASYFDNIFGGNGHVKYVTSPATLWKSKKGNWLLTYNKKRSVEARALSTNDARDFLAKYDVEKYEELFGEFEEA